MNQYGQVSIDTREAQELLLRGKSIERTIISDADELRLYNDFQDELLNKNTTFNSIAEDGIDISEFHNKCADTWLFPEEYQKLDVLDMLLKKCNNNEEKVARVMLEYKMYEDRELIMVLRLFIYLVDHMRQHKLLWGIGRGSSVSSYILFLIGAHRVDSLKYNLSISDFLK